MNTDLYHNKMIVCFYRKTEFALSSDETRVLYIKQCEATGEYAVKMKTQGDKAEIYVKTMFLATALSTLTLLMAEFGVGSQWEVLK